MIVRGFGRKEEELRILDVVRVQVYNDLDVKCGSIEVYVVPFICEPICDQKIEMAQTTFEHLMSLKLADSSDGAAELAIDVLIGADVYWEFVTGDVIKGNDGPVAVKTLLGWVLSGKWLVSALHQI